MNAFAKIRFFLILPLVCAVFFSCDPTEELPPELMLDYGGVQLFGDSTRLTEIQLQIRFQKGNGNFGLNNPDVDHPPFVGKYAYNLYLYPLDRVSLSDTVYELFQVPNIETGDMEDVVYRYRIRPLGTNSKASVKGTFDFTLHGSELEGLQINSTHGVVQFKIYAYSRDIQANGVDLEQSNIIITPDISIR